MKNIFWIFVVLLLLFGSLTVFAQREPMPTDPAAEEKPVVDTEKEKDAAGKRIREGTTFLGKKVVLQKLGTRTTVRTLDDSERFVCLENLNLERILKTIEQKPTRNIWAIDGMYTEFQGENYVLIRRAVVSSGEVKSREVRDKP